jgi:hypothetical protein
MFEPQNELERSLMQAASEPAHRPQFYRDFLASEIYVLPVGDLPETKDGIVQSDTTLALQHIEANGKSCLPFFSSVPRLQAVIREERKFLKMAVRPFLEMTKGATLLLNPGSDYGKEFLLDEVSRLIDGSMFEPQGRHVVERATEILIGEPAKYPTKLVESLQHLYRKMPQVRTAYLAHYFNPSKDKEPGLLVAVDTAGDWGHIVAESGICAQGLTPDHDHVDFVQLQQSSLADHFAKVKPFYKQSLIRRFL